jgi:hypothetical protein
VRGGRRRLLSCRAFERLTILPRNEVKKRTVSGSRTFSKRQAFFCPDLIRRPYYFTGALLSADDFTSEQNYHREKQRRHNLHCHGCGIVHGLRVSTAHGDSASTVAIQPGVAIDPAGNEIELCTTARLPLPESPVAIQVGIRFLERLSAPVPSLSDPVSSGSHPSRAEEGCEVVLTPVSMPRSRTNGKKLDILPGILPLAHLVRVRGVWRVSRKFKVSRAH